MQLTSSSIVWDIGTCTGSMAIESAKLAPEGQVFAIEKMKVILKIVYKINVNSVPI